MGRVVLSATVTADSIERLIEHFGPSASLWLAEAAQLVRAAADQWDVDLEGFYDAGWTSIIGLGTRVADDVVVLKATPDRARFLREREALEHWQRVPAVDLLAADDDRQVLLLRTVGGSAGGRPRPVDHEARVASVMCQLHEKPSQYVSHVPLLTDYYETEVLPRIERRVQTLNHPILPAVAAAIIELCRKLASAEIPSALLHSDLYAENVPFDDCGNPIFIDPLANLGDPAFDWAFWSVYYTSEGFERRLALCSAYAPCPLERIMHWAATLVLDGALFYLETGDPRLDEMLRILSSGALQRAIEAI